jgi:hypothetical protein
MGELMLSALMIALLVQAVWATMWEEAIFDFIPKAVDPVVQAGQAAVRLPNLHDTVVRDRDIPHTGIERRSAHVDSDSDPGHGHERRIHKTISRQ